MQAIRVHITEDVGTFLTCWYEGHDDAVDYCRVPKGYRPYYLEPERMDADDASPYEKTYCLYHWDCSGYSAVTQFPYLYEPPDLFARGESAQWCTLCVEENPYASQTKKAAQRGRGRMGRSQTPAP